MNGHLQRLRIKYLTFSSNPEVVVGLSGSQNVGQINLPSSIFPTANSMGWGSPRLSLDYLQILGFRGSLVLSTSPSASLPLGQPAVPAMHYESDPSSITCQLCDFRQVVFGFWDSVSSSVNEGCDLDEDVRLKCLQGQASIENEGCKSLVYDNRELWKLWPWERIFLPSTTTRLQLMV